jgi:hypothetical protein
MHSQEPSTCRSGSRAVYAIPAAGSQAAAADIDRAPTGKAAADIDRAPCRPPGGQASSQHARSEDPPSFSPHSAFRSARVRGCNGDGVDVGVSMHGIACRRTSMSLSTPTSPCRGGTTQVIQRPTAVHAHAHAAPLYATSPLQLPSLATGNCQQPHRSYIQC